MRKLAAPLLNFLSTTEFSAISAFRNSAFHLNKVVSSKKYQSMQPLVFKSGMHPAVPVHLRGFLYSSKRSSNALQNRRFKKTNIQKEDYEKRRSEAWYNGFFPGRNKIACVNERTRRVAKESEVFSSRAGNLLASELDGFKTADQQFKERNNKETKVKKSIIGNSGIRINDREPQSAIDRSDTEFLLSTR